MDLKGFFSYFSPLFVFLILAGPLKADVGETHELKEERKELVFQIKQLKKDSVLNLVRITDLQERLVAIDELIFESYDETVDRIADQKVQQSSNDRLIVFLALGACLAALFFAVMLLIARTKVMGSDYTGLRDFYKQLSLDFAAKVSPESGGTRSLNVNIVVLAGLILMGVSIISFLFKSL